MYAIASKANRGNNIEAKGNWHRILFNSIVDLQDNGWPYQRILFFF
jgi:hypothetical protein